MSSRGDDEVQRLQSLMGVLEPLLAGKKIRRQQSADRFNVFEALRVDGYEVYHSRFLAHLLDPGQSHDQADVFLTSFLKLLGLNFSPESTEGARVSTEVPLDSESRIDIFIHLANGQIVLIENKVYAGENIHTDQMARYQDWLRHKNSPTGFPHQLIFLTPKGRGPVSTTSTENIICVSYAWLADWISCSRGKAERIRIILEQYAEICRQIGGATRRETVPEEIRQFYLDPDNPGRIETALEIADLHLPEITKCLFRAFWMEVGNNLTERLKDNCRDPLWQVRFDDGFCESVDMNWEGFGIKWQGREDRAFVAVSSWANGGPMIYGIHRGKEIPREDRDPRDLVIHNNLSEKGFIGSDYWIGYRRFRQQQLPRFQISSYCDVLELRREMLDSHRPLREQVVGLIWHFFREFRQSLEDFNVNYPYDPDAGANR